MGEDGECSYQLFNKTEFLHLFHPNVIFLSIPALHGWMTKNPAEWEGWAEIRTSKELCVERAGNQWSVSLQWPPDRSRKSWFVASAVVNKREKQWSVEADLGDLEDTLKQ